MTPAKKASYGLMALLLIAAVGLHLGPIILAGLCSYLILDLTWRLFSRKLSPGFARWLSLLTFLLAASFISWMFARFIHQAIHTLPQIATTAIPKLATLSEACGLQLPFANVYDLRDVVLDEVRENADSITKASGFLTVGFFHILIAIAIAILAFFSQGEKHYGPNAFDDLRREFNTRFALFLLSFEKVFGAQVLIAAVNTLITVVFLLLLGLPHITFLSLATFILGTLPIIGNIASNAIIVGSAIIISSRYALYALIYLVLIHKGEYFLNGKIVGHRIQAPTWQTLLAILAGDIVMGVPGILLAPAVLHYAQEELRAIKS